MITHKLHSAYTTLYGYDIDILRLTYIYSMLQA